MVRTLGGGHCDSGALGAERNFALLRGIGNDALLGAPEIVIKEVLEPHAGDEQEVPAVAAALFDVVEGAVLADLAIVLAGGPEGLVELQEQVLHAEMRGRLEGIVIAAYGEGHAQNRQPLSARRVVD